MQIILLVIEPYLMVFVVLLDVISNWEDGSSGRFPD